MILVEHRKDITDRTGIAAHCLCLDSLIKSASLAVSSSVKMRIARDRLALIAFRVRVYFYGRTRFGAETLSSNTYVFTILHFTSTMYR